MKAKIIPRIDVRDRTELKNALPLDTPYVIYIDPCDTCNFRCKFCPSGNLELMGKTAGRGHGPMDFQVYKQIIDDLRDEVVVAKNGDGFVGNVRLNAKTAVGDLLFHGDQHAAHTLADVEAVAAAKGIHGL